MEIIERFFRPPRSGFFLFGPRGTGKSTFVNQYFRNAVYIDLLDPERVRFFSARPERLAEIVNANPRSDHIVIDEVQRVPDLLAVVHSLIEAKKEMQFVLTGSSSRKLKRAGVDFVVYGPDGLWAMEVKNTQKIRPDDLRGLRSFKEEYPQSKVFLLYRDKDRFLTEGIPCAPCENFLIKLRPDQTLDEIFTR